MSSLLRSPSSRGRCSTGLLNVRGKAGDGRGKGGGGLGEASAEFAEVGIVAGPRLEVRLMRPKLEELVGAVADPGG